MYISAIQPIQELYMHHVKAIYIINREKLTQVLRDELLAVVHDEDPADVQLDVVLLLLVIVDQSVLLHRLEHWVGFSG